MTRNKTLYYLTLLFYIVLLSNCSKERDELIKSDRQLHEFIPGTSGFSNASPTLVNDYIYIGTGRGGSYDVASDNAFFKLDKELNKMWAFPLGTLEVMGAATLDNMGNIYFVVGENRTTSTFCATLKLYSLSNDGVFRWSKTIWENIGPIYDSRGCCSPSVSVDNIIYIGGEKFFAFDSNGVEVWNYDSQQPLNFDWNPNLNSSIIDPAGNVYFLRNGLISLNSSGQFRWFAESSANNMSSPAFSTDYSKIFFTTKDPLNEIVCVNSSDGSVVWKYSIPGITGDIRSTPAVDDNNNIYIGTHGEYNGDSRQTLYAIKNDGTGLLWANNIGSDLYSSPALGNDRVLYIGSEGHGTTSSDYNRLHAISMLSGEIIWSAKIEMDITWSSAAISDDGTLYIASMDNFDGGLIGKVYSFRTNAAGLLQGAGWPRYHGGNASTGRRE